MYLNLSEYINILISGGLTVTLDVFKSLSTKIMKGKLIRLTVTLDVFKSCYKKWYFFYYKGLTVTLDVFKWN